MITLFGELQAPHLAKFFPHSTVVVDVYNTKLLDVSQFCPVVPDNCNCCYPMKKSDDINTLKLLDVTIKKM
jgi:hypothetical protein